MDEFMKAYTIKEVANLIDVPEGTIRQWEKDFEGILVIPRDTFNARYFTEFEIDTLKHIKAMRQKDIPKKMIKELLQKQKETAVDQLQEVSPPLPVLKQNEAVEALRNIQNTLEAFPEIRDAIISSVRDEIRYEIKKELTDAVRKEIASSLEPNNLSTSEQIKTLSESLKVMEDNYKNEVERRDKILMDNLKLMKEVKEQQQKKGFFKKLFS